MITEITSSGAEARAEMKKGVDLLADAVKVTLGAKGRFVIIRNERNGQPRSTKDGVSVARQINLTNKLQDMGAQLVKAAAEKTAVQSGDGTTTSTILAQVIISEGMAIMDEKANPVDVKKGIDKAVTEVVKTLKSMAKPVTLTSDTLVEVATISANNDRSMGEIVADAMVRVGKDGVVTIAESKTAETYVEIVKGVKIDKGYIHPYFVTNPTKMTAEYENPLIMLYERKISTFIDIEPILTFANNNKRPLLIIAEDIDHEALATLLTNRSRNNAPYVAIKLPSFGGMQKQMLEDIAIITGGNVISPDKGESLTGVAKKLPQYVGQADKIIVSIASTTIIGGRGKKEDIQAHADQLKVMMEEATSDFMKTAIKEQRLAKITNGVGCIYVGATTEIEMREKKDRIDDALRATEAAIEEGILPGGGVAYIRAMSCLKDLPVDNADEQKGVDIVIRALQQPLIQMAENAGLDANAILLNLARNNDSTGGEYQIDRGFNFKSGLYENFFISGVVDAAKVTRTALENAAGVAGMFLNTECAIIDWPRILPEPK